MSFFNNYLKLFDFYRKVFIFISIFVEKKKISISLINFIFNIILKIDNLQITYFQIDFKILKSKTFILNKHEGIK